MKLPHLLAATALACASSAFAAPIATFSSDVNGIFTDDYSLAPGLLKGNLTFSFTGESGPVTFFSALLNGVGYDLGGMAGQPASFTATVDGSQPFDLTVLGYAGNLDTFADMPGRYALSISAAVPEPASWALMAAGLLVAGAWVKRGQPVRLKRDRT